MSSRSRSSTDDIEIVSIGDTPSAMTKSARTHPEIVGESDLVDNGSCSPRGTQSLKVAGQLLKAYVAPDMTRRRRSYSADPQDTIPCRQLGLPGATEVALSPLPLPVERTGRPQAAPNVGQVPAEGAAEGVKMRVSGFEKSDMGARAGTRLQVARQRAGPQGDVLSGKTEVCKQQSGQGESKKKNNVGKVRSHAEVNEGPDNSDDEYQTGVESDSEFETNTTEYAYLHIMTKR